MSFAVELPVPPSTNNLYISQNNRRVKSPEYRAWKRAAALSIVAQVRADQRIGGQVWISITIPADTPGDVDNRIKGILDALVASGRIDDDRKVWGVSISRSNRASTAIITVNAWERLLDSTWADMGGRRVA